MNRAFNIIAVGAVLAILVVSFGLVSATNTAQPKMVGSQWVVYGENTLPNGNLHFYPMEHATTIQGGGGVEFTMPDATGSSPVFVNYILDSYTASLSESNTITVTVTVAVTSGTPTFMGNPLWTTDYGSAITPASVRIFLQANLPDNLSSGTHFGSQWNYWWADVEAYTFNSASNTMTMTVTLNPSDWSSINGISAVNANVAFNLALENIKYVGMSFGSGYFFASGVGVDYTSGTANFELNSFAIS